MQISTRKRTTLDLEVIILLQQNTFYSEFNSSDNVFSLREQLPRKGNEAKESNWLTSSCYSFQLYSVEKGRVCIFTWLYFPFQGPIRVFQLCTIGSQPRSLNFHLVDRVRYPGYTVFGSFSFQISQRAPISRFFACRIWFVANNYIIDIWLNVRWSTCTPNVVEELD